MTPMCEIKGCGKRGPYLVLVWRSPAGIPMGGHRCPTHTTTLPLDGAPIKVLITGPHTTYTGKGWDK